MEKEQAKIAQASLSLRRPTPRLHDALETISLLEKKLDESEKRGASWPRAIVTA